MHFGQAGLLALPGWVMAPVLVQWLQEARDFAAEWVELRALHHNKLCGRCLRAPLQVSQEVIPVPKASKSPDDPQQLCWGTVCKRPTSIQSAAI